jgi:hypothetical protein
MAGRRADERTQRLVQYSTLRDLSTREDAAIGGIEIERPARRVDQHQPSGAAIGTACAQPLAQHSERIPFNPGQRNSMMFNYARLYPQDREVEKILADIDSYHYVGRRNGPDCAARG